MTKLLITRMNYYGFCPGVNGVKTGFTNEAGRCLVTSISRDGFDVITVVLGADTKNIRTKDSLKLIQYTYSNFTNINIAEVINEKFKIWADTTKINVTKAILPLDMKLGEHKYNKYAINRNDNITLDVTVSNSLIAPIKENTIVGEIIVKIGENILETISILSAIELKRKTPFEYLGIILSNYNVINNTLVTVFTTV